MREDGPGNLERDVGLGRVSGAEKIMVMDRRRSEMLGNTYIEAVNLRMKLNRLGKLVPLGGNKDK